MARDLFVAQAEEIITSNGTESQKGARMQAAVTGSINIARHFFNEADRMLDEDVDPRQPGEQEPPPPAGVAPAKKKTK